MKKAAKYNYDKPIRLLQYKRPWFDIFFYSAILAFTNMSVVYLLFIHEGQFKIEFTPVRVLISIPLVMLAYVFRQLLNELRIYPPKLVKKHLWTIKELMEMTGKDRKETENIMNHVLESCFEVDNRNLKEE